MSNAFDDYPRWARKLAHSIRARLGNTFVLHGNTLDLAPAPKQKDAPRTLADFEPIAPFLAKWVFGQRDVVIEYQRANGAIFHTRESHKHFTDAVAIVDAVHGTSFATGAAARARAVLRAARFVSQTARAAPALARSGGDFPVRRDPDSGISRRIERRRSRRARLHPEMVYRSGAPRGQRHRSSLVTENLADVSSRVIRSPQTVEIEVDRPDEAERLHFLQAVRDPEWFQARSELPVERLAQLTSGLTRIQLRQILSSVDEHGTRLDAQALREQKKAVIEAECYGLLEYVESRFGLDMVSGHEGVKARLRRAAKAVLAGTAARRADGLPDCGAGRVGQDLPGELLHGRARLSRA